VTIKTGLSDNSVFFKLPKDVWFIVYEAVTYSDPNDRCSAQTVEVKPMSHDSFNYQMNNPFKRPNKSRVFRMDIESEMVEIVTKYSIDHYLMRYITQPSPIILVDLGELSINNINKKTECELNSTLHRAILKRAVDIALRRFNVANN
jgi:hypothetical protein